MEKTLLKFAERIRSLVFSNSFTEEPIKAPTVKKNLKMRQDNMRTNQALFLEIFGEEAPSWWGDFNIIKR